MICEQQKVKYEEKALAQIYEATGGDLRHSINIMQALQRHGLGICGKCYMAVRISDEAKSG